MSQTAKLMCECPKCKFNHEVSLYESINVTLSPELKDKLFRGELFKYRCPECSFDFLINHKCLYHDMKKRYMIYLIPDSENTEELASSIVENLKNLTGPDTVDSIKKEMASYKLRIVNEPNRLIEKIKILDQDINDKVIELCKMVIMFNYLKNSNAPDINKVLFDYKDENVNFIIFTTDRKSFKAALPSSTYDEILSNLKSSPLYDEEMAFKTIDLVWATDAVQNYHVLNQKH